MKTAIKRLLFVVLFSMVTTSYAHKSSVEISLGGITTLVFTNVKNGHQYRIIDEYGTVLYRETITRNGAFSKRFDFSALKDGAYTLELEKDFEIHITPFIMQKKQITFLKHCERITFKPVVRLEKDKLLISQLSLEGASLDIELLYNGERILKDEIVDGQVLNKVYQLSSKEKGNYDLRMVTGDRLFLKTFTLF
jgi:hypothetical protein